MSSLAFSPAQLIAEVVEPLTLKARTKLVLAYSGGVDSQVLAAGLAEFAKEYSQFQYLLVYVHHGLSDNATDWQQHCEAMAAQYGLPIKVKQVAVKQGSRISLEASAREARYQALEQELSQGDILLTGHHQDDQLETLLLALKRGLGPKGLAAMGKRQRFADKAWLLRPLLEVARTDIETYAQYHQIAHIEDESNQDNRFDRNFLRLDVIPTLKARWPSIAQTAARSAQLCAEQQALIEQEISLRLPAMLVTTPHSSYAALDLTLLAQQSPLWQAQLLRGFIAQAGLHMPSSVQLQQLLNQLLHAKADAKVEFKLKPMILRRFQHCLYVCAANPNPLVAMDITLSADKLQQWVLNNEQQLIAELQYLGIRVRMPHDNEQVSVRYRANSSLRCYPHFRDKGRELKKLWQELAVPPWLRAQTPLIYFNEQLVAVVGYWVEQAFIASGTQAGLVFKLK